MRIFISTLIFVSIKCVSHIFYRSNLKWIGTQYDDPWREDIKVLAFLNHTSLYEPIFVSVLPLHFLIKFTKNWVAPGADKTLDRPIVGKFWKLLAPKMTTITRKRDHTWAEFMDTIDNECIICIAPEGRMKRPNGLDVNGERMSVKGGIADIINRLDSGKIALAFSGGLHHVQKPGQMIPKIFKRININVEIIDIAEYKKQFSKKSELIKDLQSKLENNCPPQE